LLASFALDPPADVVVAAFFVTVRDAAQHDSTAFVAAVTGQLEELLGDEYSPWQGSGNDGARYLLLLKEAARKLRARGKRLVLVVDGLDEDRGAENGQPSIASLLPRHCEHGLKVVVSGRPNPRIPADVPQGHPLRQPLIVHELRDYGGAQRLRDAARLELHALLGGTELERDLLGLITAARGGLSEADLEELTQFPPFRVNSVLNSALGRVFSTRSASETDDAAPLYLMAHETLQDEAESEFGKRHLAGYRDRLHALAEDFRLRGWPPGTPQYLLTGYLSMLGDTGDVLRLIDCATDAARHDLMLEWSGSDSAALAEIGIAQEEILRRQDPDLTAMARLAFHHGELAARNVGIPAGLPAVWAALGQADRGEALADSLMPAARKAEALAKVARALAVASQYSRAAQVAERAERAVETLAMPAARAAACAEVAVAFASAGRRERAEALVESIADIHVRERTRSRVATAYAATGLHARAQALAGLIADAAKRSDAMAETARPSAENPQGDREGLLSKDLDALPRSMAACLQSAEELSAALQDSATLGVEPTAVEVIEEIADDVRRYHIWMPMESGRALARLARTLGGAGLRAATHNPVGRERGRDGTSGSREIGSGAGRDCGGVRRLRFV